MCKRTHTQSPQQNTGSGDSDTRLDRLTQGRLDPKGPAKTDNLPGQVLTTRRASPMAGTALVEWTWPSLFKRGKLLAEEWRGHMSGPCLYKDHLGDETAVSQKARHCPVSVPPGWWKPVSNHYSLGTFCHHSSSLYWASLFFSPIGKASLMVLIVNGFNG